MKKEIRLGENRFLLVVVPSTATDFKNDLENGGIVYKHGNTYVGKVDTGFFNFGISRNILGKADQISDDNITKYFESKEKLYSILEENGFNMVDTLVVKAL